MAESKRSGKTLVLLAIIVVLLLLLIGGGAWWFLGRKSPSPSPQQLAQQRIQNTKFIDLGRLVTNLQSADGATHYIQVEIELKTYDPAVSDKLKTFMPEIRDQILQLLAAQQADKVSDPATRAQLLAQIKARVNAVLNSDGGALSGTAVAKDQPISAAYFTSFVVQ